MEQIIKAQTKALGIIESMTKETGAEERKHELLKMKKEELVDLLLQKEKKNKVSVQDIAYALLCDEDVTFLDHDTLAGLIRAKVPGSKTSANSMAWYVSHQVEFGYDCKPRVNMKDIIKSLMKG